MNGKYISKFLDFNIFFFSSYVGINPSFPATGNSVMLIIMYMERVDRLHFQKMALKKEPDIIFVENFIIIFFF